VPLFYSPLFWLYEEFSQLRFAEVASSIGAVYVWLFFLILEEPGRNRYHPMDGNGQIVAAPSTIHEPDHGF
jgi:hypothetical protein